jgi:hypothetical protein
MYNRDFSIMYNYGLKITNTATKVQFVFYISALFRNYVDPATKIRHWLGILRQHQVKKYRASANGRILSTKDKGGVIQLSIT